MMACYEDLCYLDTRARWRGTSSELNFNITLVLYTGIYSHFKPDNKNNKTFRFLRSSSYLYVGFEYGNNP